MKIRFVYLPQKRKTGKTIAGIIFLLMTVGYLFMGFSDPEMFPAACCTGVLSLIFLGAASSKGTTPYVIHQQPVAQPVVQQVIHQVVQQPTPAPRPMAAVPKKHHHSSPQDLERARDFEAAADEYQRLGMYAEAGRVRSMYLENDQPLVAIGSVGDTILNDSVMMSPDDSAGLNCPSCGKEVDADFNLCPYCQHDL